MKQRNHLHLTQTVRSSGTSNSLRSGCSPEDLGPVKSLSGPNVLFLSEIRPVQDSGFDLNL